MHLLTFNCSCSQSEHNCASSHLQRQWCTVGESQQWWWKFLTPTGFRVWERNSSYWGTVFFWPLCSVKTWGFPSVNHFAVRVVTPLGLQQRSSKHSHSPPLSWWHMVLLCSSPSPRPEYLNNCFIVFHQSTWRTCPHLFFHPLCLTAIHISFPMWPNPWYFCNHFMLPVMKPFDSSWFCAADRNLKNLTVHTEPKKGTLSSVFCTGSLWFLCD